MPILEEENVKETTPEPQASSSEESQEDTEQDVQHDEQEETAEDANEVDGESMEALKSEIEQLKAEKNDIYDRMLRVQAEYENFKKRTQKERAAERKYKAQDLANELLPVIDNFERALQVEVTEETKSIIEGISMVYNQFKEALASQGVKEIEAEGKPFDPNLHHAVMQAEIEEEDSNIVVEVLQKGYILNDRVIRPAMVKVNK